MVLLRICLLLRYSLLLLLLHCGEKLCLALWCRPLSSSGVLLLLLIHAKGIHVGSCGGG